MKVAALQMISGADVSANLNQAQFLLEEAAQQGAELVLLPENFAFMGGGDRYVDLGRQEACPAGPIRQFMAQMASRHRLFLVGGTIPTTEAAASGREVEFGKVFARCFLYGPDGEPLSAYDKMHLFDVDVPDPQACYRESDCFTPGDTPVVIDIGTGVLGLSVCYDLRFPEYYRQLIVAGANILLVPAAFTAVTGQAHWEVLLRARAIENQCYVIAANQGGQHSLKRTTWGHSCVISPWGEILASCTTGTAVILADLDMSKLTTLRASMPVLQHRRL